MYVQPIYLEKRETHISEDDYALVLKRRCEISNHALIIGTLCRDPEINRTINGTPITQYQLAIDRKCRVKEDAVDNRADYPWVKSFGEQAEKDYETLRTGSVVFIDGAIQKRDIARTDFCNQCQKEYEWNDWAVEIVPYSIEYMRDFNTLEEIEKARQEKSNALVQNLKQQLTGEEG